MGKLNKITIRQEVKPLHDIEVEDNHNFVINGGVVVKNSEQYLSRESLCVLASINVARFSTIEEEYEYELSIVGESVNRFLDNVNECEIIHNVYATPHQKLAIESLRRTGAGFTNAAAWLFKQDLAYGSPGCNKALAKFTERYNYHLYRTGQHQMPKYQIFHYRLTYNHLPIRKMMLKMPRYQPIYNHAHIIFQY